MDPESEFLASKQETGHEWELSKENIRPLKRGRNVAILNQSLKSHNNFQLKKSLLANRMRLIEAIDQYEGEDPLQPWIRCIKWVQEAFPPAGDSSGLLVICEQCVRKFWDDPRYKDDLRYLNVWLEYAENCKDAEVIYSFLEANQIGLNHASFYKSYALHLESKNKMKAADDIFNRGISLKAQPIESLKAAYKKFLSRSMKKLKVTEVDPTENPHPVRSFGTVLGRDENRNPTAEGSLFAKKKSIDRASSVNSLSVYKDTEVDSRLGHKQGVANVEPNMWRSLGTRTERNKENTAVPSKWTSNKIPQRVGHRVGGGGGMTGGGTSGIEIYVDEECARQSSLKGCDVDEEMRQGTTLQLGERDVKDVKKETELLRENPLRNFPSRCLPR